MALIVEAIAPDCTVTYDSAEFVPGPAYCDVGLCMPGGVQCATCRLADAACDCCGGPAELFDDDLPLCAACGSEAA